MTILADGQVSISQSDIFQVTGAGVFGTTKVSISKVTFFNTGSVVETAILYVKAFSETARRLRQFKLKASEGGEYLEPGETLELENGDILQAKTTTANVLDFVVFGTRI